MHLQGKCFAFSKCKYIEGFCIDLECQFKFASDHMSLQVGADLTYCISMPEAAPILKGFSPDM